MKIGTQECQDLARVLSLEWLEQNGRGGFASGRVVLRALVEDLGIPAMAEKTTVRQVLVRQCKETVPPSTQQKKDQSVQRGRRKDAPLNL